MTDRARRGVVTVVTAALILASGCDGPTEAVFPTVVVTAVVVESFPISRPSGGPWDPPSGPADLSFALVDRDGRPVLDARDRPVADRGSSTEEVAWTFDDVPVEVSGPFRIELYDEDDDAVETMAFTEPFVPALPDDPFVEPAMVVEGGYGLRVRLEFRRD